MKKKLLLLGVLGQDGSLLAESLHNNYDILCPVRVQTNIKDRLQQNKYLQKIYKKVVFKNVDMLKMSDANKLIEDFNPDLICNFAAYSNVFDAWSCPKEVIEVNTVLPSIILKSMLMTSSKAKFVQASSSLVFGANSINSQIHCNESTQRAPILPYGISKNAADMLIQESREMFGLKACSAIFFNHESERRGDKFFTRKVVLAARKFSQDRNYTKLSLGSLNSSRDMGFARDFVKAIELMLDEPEAEDYIIGTGALTSMKDFVEEAFSFYGLKYTDFIIENQELIRKFDTKPLTANIMKINNRLGWTPRKFCASTLIEDEIINEKI